MSFAKNAADILVEGTLARAELKIVLTKIAADESGDKKSRLRRLLGILATVGGLGALGYGGYKALQNKDAILGYGATKTKELADAVSKAFSGEETPEQPKGPIQRGLENADTTGLGVGIYKSLSPHVRQILARAGLSTYGENRASHKDLLRDINRQGVSSTSPSRTPNKLLHALVEADKGGRNVSAEVHGLTGGKSEYADKLRADLQSLDSVGAMDAAEKNVEALGKSLLSKGSKKDFNIGLPEIVATLGPKARKEFEALPKGSTERWRMLGRALDKHVNNPNLPAKDRAFSTALRESYRKTMGHTPEAMADFHSRYGNTFGSMGAKGTSLGRTAFNFLTPWLTGKAISAGAPLVQKVTGWGVPDPGNLPAADPGNLPAAEAAK